MEESWRKENELKERFGVLKYLEEVFPLSIWISTKVVWRIVSEDEDYVESGRCEEAKRIATLGR